MYPFLNLFLPLFIALGLALVLAVMLKRKVRSEFPIFFNYLAFTAVAMVLTFVFCLIKSPEYVYIFWALSVLSSGLIFGVLYEVFVNLMKPYSAVIDLGKLMFRWAAAFLLLAAFLTALATNGSQPDKFTAAMSLMDRSLLLMQCGLLLLLLAFEKRLGLSWRSHGMCIALGLGGSAALDLTMSYVRANFMGRRLDLDLVNGLFFLGISLFWAAFLRLPEPQKSTALDAPGRLIIQRWNEELSATPFGRDSCSQDGAVRVKFISMQRNRPDKVSGLYCFSAPFAASDSHGHNDVTVFVFAIGSLVRTQLACRLGIFELKPYVTRVNDLQEFQ